MAIHLHSPDVATQIVVCKLTDRTVHILTFLETGCSYHSPVTRCLGGGFKHRRYAPYSVVPAGRLELPTPCSQNKCASNYAMPTYRWQAFPLAGRGFHLLFRLNEIPFWRDVVSVSQVQVTDLLLQTLCILKGGSKWKSKQGGVRFGVLNTQTWHILSLFCSSFSSKWAWKLHFTTYMVVFFFKKRWGATIYERRLKEEYQLWSMLAHT